MFFVEFLVNLEVNQSVEDSLHYYINVSYLNTNKTSYASPKTSWCTITSYKQVEYSNLDRKFKKSNARMINNHNQEAHNDKMEL